MDLKPLFDFQKRENDWWFFALLPIFLTLIITPIIYSQLKSIEQILMVVMQQFLNYSIILSSTDLGLRSKSHRAKSQINPPLVIIFITLIALVCTYIYYEQILTSYILKFGTLIVSIIFAYTSILLYNNNPDSYYPDSEILINKKEESERKAQEKFESPKAESTIKAKWGE